MSSPIQELDHVGVMVADLEAAGAFLAGTLGLPLEREGTVPALDVRTRFYRCGPVLIDTFETGPNLSSYTRPETSAGIVDQLFAPKP